MPNFQLLVKAFILNDDGRLLLIKKIGAQPWDIPGGLLEAGENPLEGLKRLVKDDVSLNIDVLVPLDVHHSAVADGQKTTLIIFYCQAKNGRVKLPNDVEHMWSIIDENSDELPHSLTTAVKNYSLSRFNQIVDYIDSRDQPV